MSSYYSHYREHILNLGYPSVKGLCEEISENTGIPLEEVRLCLISVDPREGGWYDEFISLLNAHKEKQNES